MKERIMIFSMCLIFCLSCQKGDNNEAQNDPVEQQEEVLAEEAEKNSMEAKEEAISVEQDVEKLLEDI